jgi:hypothetical protein
MAWRRESVDIDEMHEGIPVVWQPPPAFDPGPDWSERLARIRSCEALIAAFQRGGIRGDGPSAWHYEAFSSPRMAETVLPFLNGQSGTKKST